MNQTPVRQELRSDIENVLSAARQTSLIRQAEIEFLIGKFGKEMGLTRETHSNGQVRYRLRDGRNNSQECPGIWISQKRAYEIVVSDGLNRMDAYFHLAEKID